MGQPEAQHSLHRVGEEDFLKYILHRCVGSLWGCPASYNLWPDIHKRGCLGRSLMPCHIVTCVAFPCLDTEGMPEIAGIQNPCPQPSI